MEKFIYNSKIFRERRRDLRKEQTEAEKILWDNIRNRKLNGSKFVRQYSVDPYILDFYNPEIRLAIEVDGKIHEKTDSKIYDQERSQYFKSLDIKIIRFKNEEVIENINIVLEKIRQLLPLS
jgi:very-short-patch-repair endonuclease